MPYTYCHICRANDSTPFSAPDGRDFIACDCPRCGRYLLDRMAPSYLETRPDDERFALSGVVRAASDRGELLDIRSEGMPALLADAPPRTTLLGLIDRVLLLLAERSRNYWEEPRVDVMRDYPLVFARGDSELNYLLEKAAELGYRDRDSRRITLKGWSRIEELRAAQPNSRQAFVAMWFDKSMDAAWIHGFKPGIEAHAYFQAMRLDAVEHNEKIDDRIIAEIQRSGLLVADFTGHRGGVYFEAGFAMGLGIPVIWTCRADDVENAHFDTRQYNYIAWSTPDELRERLGNRIAATVLPNRGRSEGAPR